MNLGISVKSVIETKFSQYLDTLPIEEREQKLQEYVNVASASIQGTIDEAESLADSISSTCTSIITSVPTTIAQVMSLVSMIDPTAKAAQLTTIIESVSNSKDQLKRASSQVKSLSNILTQLSSSSDIVEVLSNSISKAMALLNTIPV